MTMMKSIKSQQDFVDKIAHEIFDLLGCEMSYMIKWKNHFTRRIADAQYVPVDNSGILRFSNFFWPHLSAEIQREVVIHETCHLVDSQYRVLCKRKGFVVAGGPHGKPWKTLMRKCGYDAPRAKVDLGFEATMKLMKTRNSVCHARCDCRTHAITKNRATRMKNGTKYYCKQCRGLLTI